MFSGWIDPVRRFRPAEPAPLDLRLHKRLGALAPLFFYAHAQGCGYAYLLTLSMAFFGVFLLGLFHEKIMRFKLAWLGQAWFIGHVALSTGLLGLIGYHAYVALSYE